MDKIKITDLEVYYHVGVPDEERAKPQRLLISIEMEHDFASAVSRDNLAETIDYYAVCQQVLTFGKDCHWQLIETLAADIAAMIQEEEMILRQSVSKLTYDNLVESWKKYTETHESPSTKYALQTTKLALEGKKIIAKVGSTLMVGMIQQENKLGDFLRFDLNDAALMLEVTYDPSLAPEESTTAPPPKRYLTPRDKLKLMMEVNPLVKDMAFRLNLKPDE